MVSERKPLFPLGQVVATPGALEELSKAHVAPSDLLDRHINGDFGESLCDEDVEANKQSLQDGSRILSSYRLTTGVKVWVITEAADDHGQRPATTLLLPSEY
ncbi:MAG: hypothetical protein H6824_10565 [Planctomycetaceae bacterium]|nr:hypothetical protein [Planctomycetaceae bacterium]